MSTSWVWLESEHLHRINNLKSDDAADAIVSYETVPKTAAQADDAGFTLTASRVAIVDTALEVASLICKTDGYPRRQFYKLPASVAHGGELPASMGPYGAIFDPVTGRNLEDRSATEIGEIIANVNNVFGSPPVGFFYKAIDGQRLSHTLSGPATVEYYDFDRPATDYVSLAALFSSENNLAPIPDEFGAIVADGSAGRVAGKAASLISEAANFMQLYYQGLRDLGLNVRMVADYSPKPS